MKKIAITTGDPAGIGPEITAKALRFFPIKENIAYIIYGKIDRYNDGNFLQKINSPDEADKSGLYFIVNSGKKQEIKL